MNGAGRRRFLDGPIARIGAGMVIAGCIAAMYQINQNYAIRTAAPRPADAGGENGAVGVVDDLNPEFIACRGERVGQVEKMLADGVIGEEKFTEFKERAIATCAGQFPPGN